MTAAENLKTVDTHFKFGENWSEYAENIDPERIHQAETSLNRLLGEGALKEKTFLDIGCGSGLFSLAALRLGATRVLSVDIDPDSVRTTQKTLQAFYPDASRYACEVVSVFDLTPEKYGTFDIVYSWGVLHHTGAMNEAVAGASRMVGDAGMFAMALYRKTRFCKAWEKEKRFYTRAPKGAQKIILAVFMGSLLLRQVISGVNPFKYVCEYEKERGMSFKYDAHDWLGGYPYESISPEDAHKLADSLNFDIVREFVTPGGMGLFGSGCDEYILKKRA